MCVDSWVAVSLGGEFNVNLVSMYAPNSPRERTQVWKEVSGLSGNSLICGDFNMVEHSSDRFMGLGYVIQGQEELDWSPGLPTKS